MARYLVVAHETVTNPRLLDAVLGVRERMEIWDRGEFERYRDVHAAAYENGELEPRGLQSRPV